MPAPSALAARVMPAPVTRPVWQTNLERHPNLPCGPESPDEVIVGIALTVRWMLTTGRRLDQRPALHDLGRDQLIDFWADDHLNGFVTISCEAGNA